MLLIFCILIFGGFKAADARQRKLGSVSRELQSLDSHIFDVDILIEKKLEQMENSFEEKLNSVESYYKQKLTDIENRLSESEKRQQSTEIFYENKLAEVMKRCNNINQKVQLVKKFSDSSLAKLEKIVDNIEEKLIEATKACENKFNKLGHIWYRADEKRNSDWKSEVELLPKIERSDVVERKLLVNTENTGLDSNNGVSHVAGLDEINVSTLEIDGHALVDNNTNSTNEDGRSNDTVNASLTHRRRSHIAFSVYLTDSVMFLGREDTIPFDGVLLNEGQAFDPAQHVFTCPVNGSYMFQAATTSAYQDLIVTEIVKDGEGLVIMYAAGADSGSGFDQGFNSAIIQCNKGERVWVRVYKSGGTKIMGFRYTTFSGYLLWKI